MRNIFFTLSLTWLLSVFCTTADAVQAVLQRGYDTNVSGANLTETTLTPSNISVSTFGQVFNLPVDDNVYAQPLYVPGVLIPGQGTHNVVYIVTESDTLYAFDADVGGNALWSENFAGSVGATPVPIAKFTFGGNKNITGNLGILSTPVIDPTTNLMYLVAATVENNNLVYRLHAVEITTGYEPYPNVVIGGTYGGVKFTPQYQTQRVSLTLAKGEVVFAFAAVELEQDNIGGYVGWVMSYNKSTLQQDGIYAASTTGDKGAGIWQSGRPPAVDSSGDVYVFTGNGYSNGYDGVNDFSESALKLDPGNGLALLDWFTQGDWSYADEYDLDLSSSGPILFPGTNLMGAGGKEGNFYLLNTTNLGKFNANDSQVVQKQEFSPDEIRGGPVYWQRSTANGGPRLYNWSATDTLKAYSFNGSVLSTGPVDQGPTEGIWPGGTLTLSANADTHGTGVIWSTLAQSGDAENNPPVPGMLVAYNAENLSAGELWDSTQNATRDGFGNLAKFVPPTVANGKVYVATFSNQVAVYGLLPTSFTLTATTSSQTVMEGNAASYALSIGAISGFSGTVSFSVSGLPAGAAASFSPSTVTGSGSTTLTVTTSSSTPVATSTLTITGTSGSLTQTANVSLTVTPIPAPSSFGLSTTTLTKSVLSGGTASYPLSVAATNGFSGTVGFTVTGLPAGATASFTPSTVTGSGGTTLNVTTTSGTTPLGTSTLTITGTSGSLTQSTSVTLAVVSSLSSPSFSLTPTTTTDTVAIGSTASYPLTVGALNGFSGAVALSVSGLPAGTTASFSPSTVNGSGATTLSVTTSGTTPAGTSTLTITGTSGSLSQSTSVTLAVTNTAGIGIQFVGQGTTLASTAVAGVVSQSNWNPATGANSTSALALVDGSGLSTGASVTWSSNGIYSLPIATTTANDQLMSGYLDAETTPTTVTVSGLPLDPVGYKVYVYADGDNGSGNRTGAYQISGTGITTTSVNLTDAANTNFSGTFVQANNSAGNYVLFTVTGTSFTITATPGTASDGYPRAPINAIQIVPQTATTPTFALTATTSSQTVTAGKSASYALNVEAEDGFSGTVSLSVSGLPTGATASLTPSTVSGSGAATLTVTTSSTMPASSSTLTVTGTSGSVTQTANVALVVTASASPSFSLTPTTSSQTVAAGSAASYGLSVGALSGFTGTVGFTVSGLPTGATASFIPSTVTGSGSTTLNVTTSSTTPVGTSTLTVTGTSGSITQTANVALVVTAAPTPSFSLTPTTSSQTVTEGNAASYALSVGALNGFTGAVGFTVSGLPTGATASFVPSTVTGSGSTTLNVTTSSSTPVGTSTLTITGTSGSLTQSTGVTLVVAAPPPPPSFSLSATTSTQSVLSGGTASYALSVGALNGFTSTVGFTVSGLPTGATASFVPSTVTGSGSTTLNVTTTSGTTPLGTSTLTITGTSGSLTQSTSVTLAVVSSLSPGFSVTPTTTTDTVAIGSTASYPLTIAAVNGFSGAVALSVSGLPAGTTASFSPSTVTGSGATTLSVVTGGATPGGTSTLTITGTSGSLTQSTSVTLAVTNTAGIGIQFVGQGTALASTAVAGVVSQSHWNQGTGSSSTTPLALVDGSGLSTGASVTWSANGVYNLPIATTTANEQLMSGYLDAVGTPTTVTVSGLPLDPAGYTVYVYADGDNGSGTRIGAYQISGTGITTTSVNLTDAANTNFSGTFMQANNSAGNYVVFTVPGTGFTITATPGTSTDAWPRSPVNAIQVVPN